MSAAEDSNPDSGIFHTDYELIDPNFCGVCRVCPDSGIFPTDDKLTDPNICPVCDGYKFEDCCDITKDNDRFEPSSSGTDFNRPVPLAQLLLVTTFCGKPFGPFHPNEEDEIGNIPIGLNSHQINRFYHVRSVSCNECFGPKGIEQFKKQFNKPKSLNELYDLDGLSDEEFWLLFNQEESL
jgi:hypothetical protein